MTTTPLTWLAPTSLTGNPAENLKVTQLANGNILLVWQEEFLILDPVATSPGIDLIGRILDAAGNPLTSPFQVNPSFNEANEINPRIVALSGGGFAVVYYQTATSGGFDRDARDLRFERFDANGEFLSSGTIATNVGVNFDHQVFASNVVLLEGEANSFDVVYQATSSNGSSRVRMATIEVVGNSSLISRDIEIAASGTNSQFFDMSATRLENGNTVLVYRTPTAVIDLARFKYTIIDPNGVTVAEPQIAANTDLFTGVVVTALAGGGFVMATTHFENASATSFLRYRIFDSAGNPVTGVTDSSIQAISVRSVSPLADGGFIVFAFDPEGLLEFGQRFDANGNPVGTRFEAGALNSHLTDDGRVLVADTDSNLRIFDPRDAGAVIDGTNGADQLTAPVPGGTVNGKLGNDRIWGHDGIDVLNGNNGADHLTGAKGNDTLDGGNAADTVEGNQGNDIVKDTDGANGDHQDGGVGIDTLDYRGSTYANNVIEIDLALGRTTNTFTGTFDTILRFENVEGSDRGETVIERAGANIINLNGGNDRLAISNAAIDGDVFDGGAGNDTFDLSRMNWISGSVRVDLGAGTWSRNGASEAVTGFENITGGNGTVGEALTGSTGDNRIDGRGANDIIRGAEGFDTLIGGAGDDTFDHFATDIVAGESVDGGTGNDTIQMSGTGVHRFDLLQISSVERIASIDFTTVQRTAQFNAAQFVSGGMSLATTIDGNSQAGARDIVRILMNGQLAFSAAAFTFTDWGPDGDLLHLQGGVLGETMTGSSAADLIEGGAGNDILRGGGGGDTLRGGDNDDRLIIEAPGDVAAGETYDGGNGRDRLEIAGLGITDLTAVNIASIEAISFTGEPKGQREAIFAAVQFGEGAIDPESVIESSSTEHADILTVDLLGKTSVDLSLLSFGVWGAGGDLVKVIGSSGNDLIAGSAVADEIDAGDGDDVISGGGGDDLLLGGIGHDAIEGGAGDDTVRGGPGNDDITGGLGKDRLTGNGGIDTFIYTNAAESPTAALGDRITDFTQGTDLVDVSALQIIAFIGDAAFSGVGQSQLRFTQNEGNSTTRLQGDIDGDGDAELVVTFTGLITFQQTDFVF